jgi:hypothetical protein
VLALADGEASHRTSFCATNQSFQMKNKFLLLLNALLLQTIIGFAQSTAIDPASIKGTPYLEDVYAKGVICYADKNHSVPIRYNAYQDLIEYQQSGRALVLDANATVKKVTFNNTTFVPLTYEVSGKSKLGYFAMLDSGRVSLFAKKKIVFIPAKQGGALDGSNQPAEYRKSPDVYYIKVGDGPLQEVGNLKSLIAAFPDKQDELSQFAKKEKISPRKEKELVQLVQHYNSL